MQIAESQWNLTYLESVRRNYMSLPLLMLCKDRTDRFQSPSKSCTNIRRALGIRQSVFSTLASPSPPLNVHLSAILLQSPRTLPKHPAQSSPPHSLVPESRAPSRAPHDATSTPRPAPTTSRLRRPGGASLSSSGHHKYTETTRERSERKTPRGRPHALPPPPPPPPPPAHVPGSPHRLTPSARRLNMR